MIVGAICIIMACIIAAVYASPRETKANAACCLLVILSWLCIGLLVGMIGVIILWLTGTL